MAQTFEQGYYISTKNKLTKTIMPVKNETLEVRIIVKNHPKTSTKFPLRVLPFQTNNLAIKLQKIKKNLIIKI